MQFLKIFLDFVFPPRCEACSALGPEIFCSSCRAQISYLKPSAFVHCVGIYEDPLKKVILRFKYGKKRHLSRPLGELMSKYLSSTFDVSELDFFMPVPLHEKRLSQRGFNQSEALSQELSRHFGLPTVTGLLQRVKETKPQFDLPKKERFKNVKGAFVLTGAPFIRDKKIMLVDDIYTTGSTISECTRVLKDNGARAVHVLTLSKVLDL